MVGYRLPDYSIYTLRGALKSKKYFFLEHSSEERLRYLHMRWERNLLSYDAFDANELRAFCCARKLELPKGVKQTRRKFSNLLEATDDDDGTTFSNFLRLPPEVRNKIYDIHIDWLAKRLPSRRDTYEPDKVKADYLVVPPPITAVCHALRREVLPLFFHSFCWRVRIVCRKGEKKGLPDHAQLSWHRYGDRQKSPPDELLRLMTRFRVDVQFNIIRYTCKSWSDPARHCSDAWDVDLPWGAWSARFHRHAQSESWISRHSKLGPFDTVIRTMTGNELTDIFEDIAGREEGMRLERKHLLAMLDVYMRVQGAVGGMVRKQRRQATDAMTATSGA